MKIALIYDDLYQKGGGEKLFLNCVSVFPEAVIYVPIVSKYYKELLKGREVISSRFLTRLSRLPFFGYSCASFLSIFWFESLNFSKYTKVLSVSNRWSHSINTPITCTHYSLITTPMRFVWESNTKNVLLNFTKTIFRVYSYFTSKRIDVYITISNYSKQKIHKFWNIEKSKIHVLSIPYTVASSVEEIDLPYKDYFLLVGRLNKYKTFFFDNALRLLSSIGHSVILVGRGPEKNNLLSVYKNNTRITLLDNINDAQLAYLYKSCIAFVHPQIEDFGLTPLEALYYNKPVIALKRGGVIDYLSENVSLLYNKNTDFISHVASVRDFKFDSGERNKILKIHSYKNFEYNLRKLIEK